jgi:hypothetical protein
MASRSRRFDIVNSFTNTTVDKALKRIRNLLEADKNLETRTHHNVGDIMEMITVCVMNTYFQFDENY